MNALETIWTHPWVERIGWTLFHTIWQGVIVAVLLAFALWLLRRSSANLRYVVGCVALGLVAVLPLLTFMVIGIPAQDTLAGQPAETPASLSATPVQMIPVAEVHKISPEPRIAEAPMLGRWQRVAAFIEPGLPFAASAWVLGVFALSLWNLGAWLQLQRLRSRRVRPVTEVIEQMSRDIAGRLGVTQAVRLLESAMVQVPTVVGWIKPVILLPASALTGLTSVQLEALLAHELAHIGRLDYLVNIVQRVVEIMGFYHPAVWWISGKIRAERENCCDDLAVRVCGDRLEYVHALTSMEEIRGRQSELAVAASGGCLLHRVRRLLGTASGEKKMCDRTSAVINLLIVILVVGMSAMLTFADVPVDVSTADAQGTGQDPPVIEISSSPVQQSGVFNPDAPRVRIDFSLVELSADQSLDHETAVQVENLIGQKGRPEGSVVSARQGLARYLSTAQISDEQAEKLLTLLGQRGVLKILLRPSVEVIDGEAAKIATARAPDEPDNEAGQGFEFSIGITPNANEEKGLVVLEIDLDMEFSQQVATSKDETGKELPILSRRSMSSATKVAVKNGATMCLNLGGMETSGGDDGTSTAFMLLIKPSLVKEGQGPAKAPTKEEIARIKSMERLKALGVVLAMYANENDGQCPDALGQVKPYCQGSDFDWFMASVRYVGEGKTFAQTPDDVVAFDRKMLKSTGRTAVLFADGHVSLLERRSLQERGVGVTLLRIEANILSVPQAFLEDPEIDALLGKEVKPIGGIQAGMPGRPVQDQMSQPVLMDAGNVQTLLKAMERYKEAKVLSSPTVMVWDGDQAEMALVNQIPVVKGFVPSKKPGEKPTPEFEWTWVGVKLKARPRLARAEDSAFIETSVEVRSLLGHETQQSHGQSYEVPTLESMVVTTDLRVPLDKAIFVVRQAPKMSSRPDTKDEEPAPAKSLLIMIKVAKPK